MSLDLKNYVAVQDLKQHLGPHIAMKETQREETAESPRSTCHLAPRSGSKSMMTEGALLMRRQGPWGTADRVTLPREQDPLGGFPSLGGASHMTSRGTAVAIV